MRNTISILVLLGACGDDGGSTTKTDAPKTVDASTIDARTNFPDAPTGCPATEIKFTQAHGCESDGGVEWCIPDNNATLQTQLLAIEPAIHCGGGGGRANCNASPGLLLCSYPTAFPAQCLTDHGAMNDQTFADMCAIAAFPEITEIVFTILE